MLKNYLNDDWYQILKEEFDKDYFKELESFLDDAYENHTIYPEKSHIFHAFNLTHFIDVKVVLIGQDPYHGQNQAQGLSFSVPMGEKLPPSLKNIFKELLDDVGITKIHGDLEEWAKQGILMINDVLTVEASKARSHRNKGWEHFTKAVIESLNDSDHPIVYILWGNDAIKKEKIIDKKHHIIKGPHPSPLSSYRGFFGSKPFSKVNDYLNQDNLGSIEW
ncbi:uracil-DNA glycosylase [Acidaminobacter sp. JC074]|uniref:uracil-DNA glycosylase n=1 Tax=Acidaminobacter sp. JC074 TaxID=2530199 RepID=UPI001F0D069F|nr:uracil-DNA glycosylase [Acidaminobacter sp. JC074]